MATRSAAPSFWSPFRHRTYAVIWTATLLANIGTWMYSSASAWLMTSLSADPLMVSLVQVAASLPMFLFALPAGALADIVDTRRLMILVEGGIILVAIPFAILVELERVTPITLLMFTFLLEAGAAMSSPAWQSIVPQLVPREDLPAAVAANSVGVNISRALGPALGGIAMSLVGVSAPFWVNAFSNVGSIGALVWWKPAPKRASSLPAERLASAVRTGIRYARNSRPLRATLVRAVAFFMTASAYWALLPLVARTQIAGGPQLYGMLLGAIGVGAIAGAFALQRLKARLGADRLVALAQGGTGVALALFAVASTPATAFVASFISGTCWIAAVSSLNVSTQVALPSWVRARGLAVYVTVFFGAMTLGSLAWGEVASLAGLPIAHLMAAAAAIVAIPLTWSWKLQKGAGLDLSPSMSWPEPILAEPIDADQGPVMVMIEYQVERKDREAFLEAFDRVGRERKRNGAYAWGLFEDAARIGRFVETFYSDSWMEHLRQHERVTQADRLVEEKVRRFAVGEPTVTHFVAVR